MERFNPRRDAFVLLALVVLLIMLGAGLAGAPRVFGFAFTALVGLFTGLGFIRRGDRTTWVPPVLATAVLAIGMAGMFLNESAVVESAADTVLGFHPGTAFLVYVVWIPAFFTMGVSFAILFRHLTDDFATAAAGSDARRKDAAR